MNPIWYTIRIVVTLVMTGIGALLLWAASAVAPNVNGAALAWMVLLGLAIPIGFFVLFTLVGWQRSTAVTTLLSTVHSMSDRFTWGRVRVGGGESLQEFIANLGPTMPSITVSTLDVEPS